MRTCLGALLWLAGSVAAAQQPVTISKVAGQVHVIDGAIDRIGVAAGPDGILLVDGGYMESLPDVRKAIASVAPGAVATLINTHWHHSFANPGFGDATIIAHENVARRMIKPNLMFNRLVPPGAPAGLPDETFTTVRSLHFNGEQIDIISFAPAHTDSDAIVIFRGSRVVFTGDLFVPHLSWIDYGSGGSLPGLLAALDRLVEIVPADAILVPGHGRTSTYRDLLTFRAAVRLTEATVRVGMEKGQTLAQIIERGLPAELKPWLGGGVPEALVIESFYKGLNRQRSGATCEFVNGRWFNGREFSEEAGFWTDRGFLTRSRPARVECTVDLDGRYVMAPLAEAHTHKLGSAEQLDSDEAALISAGVLYAMVQDPAHVVPPELKARTSDRHGVEAIYAQGVITPSWGVMPDFYRLMAERGMLGEGVAFDDARDNLFFTIDNEGDLRRKWPQIVKRNDRFVKVILAFSDQLEKRRNNPAFDASPPLYSKKPGLDPRLLPIIVERAHADGLAVSAHIETAADFRAAVAAGVDYIAHLPGSWQIGRETGYEGESLDPWLLTEEDARAARSKDVRVITTTYRRPDDSESELHRRAHAHNVALLAAAGVPLLTGSDAFDATVADELASLDTLGVLPRAALLDAATRVTPLAIFPGRKIGKLGEDHEASFVVFDQDPLSGTLNQRPSMVVKNGTVLLDREADQTR